MLFRLTSLVFFALLLPGCATSVPGGGGEGRVDARPIDFVVDAARADAQPGSADANPPISPDAAIASTTATITGDCLFIRTGAGTENAKLACTDSGTWCNAQNDVCVPMGETVSVVGSSQSGTGCVAEWFPVEYRTYSGWSCGSFLAFPTSAKALLPIGHQTLYPSAGAGPQG
tara:strand:- start:29161 stop:29679 length:519 start_codon:yes stop_codon:yes gene_type:complete